MTLFPIRVYVFAGLSVLSLGYCVGTCGSASSAEKTQSTAPSEESMQIHSILLPALSSLEKRIKELEQIQQPTAPEPTLSAPTLEQRFLHLLQHPPKDDAAPLPSDISFLQPPTSSGDPFFKGFHTLVLQSIYRVRNEACYNYAETKNYLKDKCKEAVK